MASQSTQVKEEVQPVTPQLETMWLDPKWITLDAETQTRKQSKAKIEEYAQAMRDSLWKWESYPLIVVWQDGDKCYPSDGHHRVQAAILAEVDSILVEIRQGTLQDAIWESLASNKGHGLALTNDDKRDRVRIALKHIEWSKFSDNAIADHCGVSAPFVAKIRAELIETSTINVYSERVGKDGKTRNTDNIGKGKATKAKQEIPDEINVLGVNLQKETSPKEVAIAALRLCEPHEKREVLEMIVNKLI